MRWWEEKGLRGEDMEEREEPDEKETVKSSSSISNRKKRGSTSGSCNFSSGPSTE